MPPSATTMSRFDELTTELCATRRPVPLSFRWAFPATDTTGVLPIPSAGGASAKAKPGPAGDV